MKVKKISVLCLALFIYSCATFHPVPISPKQVAVSFQARRLDDPHLRKFLELNLHHKLERWTPKSWDFAMLTLVAYYYHPDLDVARAKWEEAHARITAAGEMPNPTATFVPGYNFDARAEGLTPWQLNYSADIPFETAGKRDYRVAQAIYNAETAYLDIATTSWEARSRVRARMLNLYKTIQVQDILNRQLAIEEENVKTLESRLAGGGASISTVTQARISLNKTLISLREIEKQNKEARIEIANALGVPASALDGVKLGFDVFDNLSPSVDLEDAEQYALLNRPDILGALAEYGASQSALQLEIAKQYPDIHLGPGYSYNLEGKWWQLGLSLTLPIFNQNKGAILEAEARRKESMARFNLKQSNAISEVDRAIASYSKAREKIEAADSLLSTQKRYMQLIQSTTGQGEVHRVALLNAQSELASDELARLDALIEAQQSYGSLEDAVRCPLNLVNKIEW